MAHYETKRELLEEISKRAKQVAFEDFSRLWPQARQVMTDAARFSRRQTMKRLGGRALLIGGGYEAGRRLLRPIFGGLEGGGDGGGFSQ